MQGPSFFIQKLRAWFLSQGWSVFIIRGMHTPTREPLLSLSFESMRHRVFIIRRGVSRISRGDCQNSKASRSFKLQSAWEPTQLCVIIFFIMTCDSFDRKRAFCATEARNQKERGSEYLLFQEKRKSKTKTMLGNLLGKYKEQKKRK